LLLSVFTRHSSECKYNGDRTYRRCNCPKWIGGQVNKEYFRKSACTRQWGEAEELRLKLEDAVVKGLPPFGPAPTESLALVASPQVEPPSLESPHGEVLPPRPKKPRVTVDSAVHAYISDARSRGLGEDTLRKLETIFRKQFLVWCGVQGFVFIDEIDLDVLRRFRSTWKDAPLSGQKKKRIGSSAFSGPACDAVTSKKTRSWDSERSKSYTFQPTTFPEMSSRISSTQSPSMGIRAADSFLSKTLEPGFAPCPC